MSKPDRRIDYIEFPATDIGATKKFYAGVFGWEFVDYGPDYVAFSGAYVDGGFAAGAPVANRIVSGQLDEQHERATRGVLVVLYAKNLEETRTDVAAAGAEVVRDIFSFPGGRRFHFIDPNGNEVAVWSE